MEIDNFEELDKLMDIKGGNEISLGHLEKIMDMLMTTMVDRMDGVECEWLENLTYPE